MQTCSNQEIRELGKLLNVDAVLLWGTNIASDNFIYFRLVKLALVKFFLLMRVYATISKTLLGKIILLGV